MNKDLVSVILPVYNVKEYLEFCIDSVINQTYNNLEIIIVDDGSTDESGEIANVYAKKDSRIKVIHKENGGLSDARNVGMYNCKGEYIVFIDSDDYINYNYIEILYNLCIANNSQISICSFERTSENKKNLDELNNLESYTLSGRDTIKNIYMGKGNDIAFTVWNKMYKKSLFIDNNIEYPKGKLYEDELTTYKLLYLVDKVSITRNNLYYYRIRNNSIMRSNVNEKKIKDSLYGDAEPLEYYKNKNDIEILSLCFNCFCRNTIQLYESLKNSEYSNMRDYVANYYHDVFNKYYKCVKLMFIKKMKYFLYNTFIIK